MVEPRSEAEGIAKKEYQTPRLRCFGRVTDLTAGGSTGGREDKAMSRNKRA